MTDVRCLRWRRTFPATTLAVLHPACSLPGSGSIEHNPCSSLITAERTLSDSAKAAPVTAEDTVTHSTAQSSAVQVFERYFLICLSQQRPDGRLACKQA